VTSYFPYFVMLNLNPAAKLVYHVKILKKIEVKCAKKGDFGYIHYVIVTKVIFFLNYNGVILKLRYEIFVLTKISSICLPY